MAFNKSILLSGSMLCSMAAEGQDAAGSGKAPATPAPKTVAEDMTSRRVFATPQEAAEYLTASAGNFSDFGDMTLAAPGVDAEGNFDPEIYGEGTAVMVALLRNKSKIKAIVVAPIPTLDNLLGDDAGRAWVERIIQKELNHVAVRPLREAEDVSTMVDQMPTTRDAYISSARDAGGGIMEAFNELYKPVNATLSAKIPVWAKARLIKSELRKAMESRGYALEYYPALEDRGEGNDSLFVVALNLAINTAKRKGLDPTIFERWLSTRDQKAFTPGEQDDDESFDIDSLADSLLADEAAPAASGDNAEGQGGEPSESGQQEGGEAEQPTG